MESPPAEVTDAALQGLYRAHKGPIYTSSDPAFANHIRIWNGSIVTRATILARPRDATDVALLIKFCKECGLAPSVKAGGYGVAGWSISGDLVIDLSLLRDIAIDIPSTEPDSKRPYTPLRERASIASTKPRNQPPLKPLPSDFKRRKASEAFDDSSEDATVPDPFTPITPGMDPRVDKEATSAFLTGRLVLPERAQVQPASEDGPTADGDERRPAVRRRLHSPQPSSPTQEVATRIPAGLDGVRSPPSSDHHPVTNNPSVAPLSSLDGILSPGRASAIDPSDPLSLGPRERSQASTYPIPETSAIPPSILWPPSWPPASHTINSLPRTDGSLFPRPRTAEDPFAYVFGQSTAGPGGGPYPHYSPLRAPTSFAPISLHMPSWMMHGSGTDGFSSSSASASASVSASSSGLDIGSSATPGSSAPSSDVSPPVPHIYVTFGAGMGQRAVDRYLTEHPVPARNEMGHESSIPYYVPFAAHPVGSGVMLLGGFGFLSRMHGLSVDAVVEVEMVLADGSIVVANENENSDLLWAMRGAGPAFGVVTRYVAKAYPVPIVTAGNLVYNFRPETAPSLIKHVRDCCKDAPPEQYVIILMTAGPKPDQAIIVVQICYVGNKAKANPFIQALLSCDVEKCLLNEVGEKSFLKQQESVAKVLRGQAGFQWFLMSDMISSLTDEMINDTCIKFQNTPPSCTWFFELAAGRIPEFEGTCLPDTMRKANFNIAALHQWPVNHDDPRCIDTAADWIDHTVGKTSVGGPLPSFAGRETLRRVIGTYGEENWTRLKELKRKYDPERLFRHSFWPKEEDLPGLGEETDGVRTVNKGKERAVE